MAAMTEDKKTSSMAKRQGPEMRPRSRIVFLHHRGFDRIGSGWIGLDQVLLGLYGDPRFVLHIAYLLGLVFSFLLSI